MPQINLWFIALCVCSLVSLCFSPIKCIEGNGGEKSGWDDDWLLDCRNVLYSLCINHRFTSFPEVLYQIVSLETVLLGNNQVNVVDPCRLIKLVRLSTLDLSNNDLMKIPPELGLCTSLRYVCSVYCPPAALSIHNVRGVFLQPSFPDVTISAFVSFLKYTTSRFHMSCGLKADRNRNKCPVTKTNPPLNRTTLYHCTEGSTSTQAEWLMLVTACEHYCRLSWLSCKES